MRFFQKIAEGVDVLPLLHDVTRRDDLWNRYRVRTHHERTAHRMIDDIILRYNKFEPTDDFVDKVCASIDVANYPPFYELAGARDMVMALMGRLKGEHLGRAFISRMRPGVCIPPHTDRIAPAEEAFPDRIIPAQHFDRYHVVLKSQPGVVFRTGDEQVYMAPGEVWWFQNEVEHEVANHSGDDRIHLVVDIHVAKAPYEPEALV